MHVITCPNFNGGVTTINNFGVWVTDNMMIKDILNQSHKAHNELIQKYTIQNINVHISALNG